MRPDQRQLHAVEVETDSSSDRSHLAQDINNLAAERAVADYDRTHIFGANYVIELPFFRDESNKLKWNLLGGWQISGYTRYESGVPLTITQSANTMNSTGNIQRRPNLVGEVEGAGRSSSGSTPRPSRCRGQHLRNSPRSVVRAPYRHVTDLALFKNFIVTDRVRLQYRLEAFNVFNHANFTGVGTVLGRRPSAGSPRRPTQADSDGTEGHLLGVGARRWALGARR